MTNGFYTPTSITGHSTARSSEVNAQLSGIEAGFDMLPTEANLKRGKVQDAVDSGVANAYVLTATHAPSAYAAGDTFRFRPGNTNSTASTVNIYNASSVLIGVVALKNYAGAALSGGEVVISAYTTIVYDATNGYFRIESPLTSVASVSVNNNVKGDATDALPGTIDDKLTVSGSLVKTVVDAGSGNRKVNLDITVDEGQLALSSGWYAL